MISPIDERIYRGMWIWAMIAVLLAAMLVDNQQNITEIVNLLKNT
jgi:hypothetical protein